MCRVIHVFGDDVSTDTIYPGRFMATMLPNETPQYAFADIPELNGQLNHPVVKGGKSSSIEYEDVIIVAGDNFGCGSSREQAVSTLVGNNVIVVAKSFARIFKQNAINLGLRIYTCPDIKADVGHMLKVRATPNGITVDNSTTGMEFKIESLPASAQEVLNAGGLIPYTRNRLQMKPKGLLKRFWKKIKEQL